MFAWRYAMTDENNRIEAFRCLNDLKESRWRVQENARIARQYQKEALRSADLWEAKAVREEVLMMDLDASMAELRQELFRDNLRVAMDNVVADLRGRLA